MWLRKECRITSKFLAWGLGFRPIVFIRVEEIGGGGGRACVWEER